MLRQKHPRHADAWRGCLVWELFDWLGDDDEALAVFIGSRRRPARNQGELLVIGRVEELEIGDLFLGGRTLCRDERL